ncbi:TIM barrel protein [Poseidonocella sp. HB161398]|uniref:TIM barrel protein n=1 Tax=Poseidonocella sp. HB161398 TaxID=2320855 RepID=UPI001108796B|nr:TIM barrel protein [Poseidonocella sp. HB161398]
MTDAVSPSSAPRLKRALNQKTARHLPYEGFLDLAAGLGCVGVEARNDLGRPVFDGIDPAEAGAMARDRGLRLLGLSEVYAFNAWTPGRADAVAELIATAHAAGAETVSLIPAVMDEFPAAERQERLIGAMRQVAPMLDGTEVVALIEPIGFARSSLKDKAELAAAIAELGDPRFAMVHDTFQHVIAGQEQLYPALTGMVHISGISDPAAPLDEGDDARRILVEPRDRCGNAGQIRGFLAAGYEGAFSFECTEPGVQESATLAADLRASFELIEARLGL